VASPHFSRWRPRRQTWPAETRELSRARAMAASTSKVSSLLECCVQEAGPCAPKPPARGRRPASCIQGKPWLLDKLTADPAPWRKRRRVRKRAPTHRRQLAQFLANTQPRRQRWSAANEREVQRPVSSGKLLLEDVQAPAGLCNASLQCLRPAWPVKSGSQEQIKLTGRAGRGDRHRHAFDRCQRGKETRGFRRPNRRRCQINLPSCHPLILNGCSPAAGVHQIQRARRFVLVVDAAAQFPQFLLQPFIKKAVLEGVVQA